MVVPLLATSRDPNRDRLPGVRISTTVAGHLQTVGGSKWKSTLLPKADISDAHRHVRFGPQGEFPHQKELTLRHGVFVRNTGRSAMRYAAAVVILLSVNSSLSFAQGHQGTPQEQAACRRDASRFCRQQMADDFAVQQCLLQNRARLSHSCQKVFQSHGM
jgi:hypothetical protein